MGSCRASASTLVLSAPSFPPPRRPRPLPSGLLGLTLSALLSYVKLEEAAKEALTDGQNITNLLRIDLAH